MSFSVSIRPAAESDIAEAATWYDQQELGLGSEFVTEVIAAISRISENPRLTSRRHRRQEIRWVYTARFPYRVIFGLLGDRLTIFGVLHAARDQSVWQRRIET